MYHQKMNARSEYRKEQGQRIKDSASIADTFPLLKSLTVDLAYYSSEGFTRGSQIRYEVNLANAKSLFAFTCHNTECVRGDFDLSKTLVEVVAARQTRAAGEIRCQGWRNKGTIGTVHCHNILRYKLTLAYS